MRQAAPELHLQCEDILIEKRKGISLIELNNEKIKLQPNGDDKETELNRIEKLEKMMENLNGSVKSMTEELKSLKSAINKKNNNKDINMDIINKTLNFNQNKNDKPSILKMKTFNDLQLDINNLIKTDVNNNDNEFLSHTNSDNTKEKTKVKYRI
jgi:hypothetical protein